MPRQAATATPRVDGKPAFLRPRDGLSEEIAEIFVEIVSSVPPEHFRPGDAPLIEQYAQAIALARQAYSKIERDGAIREDGKRSPAVDLLEKAHRSSVALCARLRLSPQSRTDPKTAGKKAAGNSPYDTAKQ